MSRTFSGTQYFSYTGASPVTGPPFTISVFGLDTSSNNSAAVSIARNGTATRHLLYEATSVGLAVFSGNAGTSGQYSGGGSVRFGSSFSHAAMVVSSDSDRKLYHAGAYIGQNTTLVTPVGGLDRIDIATYYNNGIQTSFNFIGSLAEVAVYNAVLSDDEIAGLARGVSPLLVRPSALRGYWPMHGRATNEEDWVGHHLLTPTGTSTVGVHPRLILPRTLTTNRYAGGGPAPTVRRPIVTVLGFL